MTPDAVRLDPAKFAAEIGGQRVALYTLSNAAGMSVSATNLGGKIQQILVPDRDGRLGDVALGYDSVAQIMAGQPSMGAFIGRYANRIADARFTLDGTTYQLNRNDGPNTLHGGTRGSRFVVFDVRQVSRSSVEMDYVFRDGEENFPGNLATRVVYALSDNNELTISWHAVTDRRTVASFTSHVFFNLAGAGCGDILGHALTINANRFAAVDANRIPDGDLRAVTGTPFDFRTPRPIGAAIDAEDAQLSLCDGYDHNFALTKSEATFALAARVTEPISGRMMECWTTEPGLQFYSGNNLDGRSPRDIGKGGKSYGRRAAFCLEPQRFPDAPNRPDFPSSVVAPAYPFVGTIVYRFSTV